MRSLRAVRGKLAGTGDLALAALSAVSAVAGFVFVVADAASAPAWTLVAIGYFGLGLFSVRLWRRRVAYLPGDHGPGWSVVATRYDQHSVLIFVVARRDQQVSSLSCTVEAPSGVCTTAFHDYGRVVDLKGGPVGNGRGWEYPKEFPGAENLAAGGYGIEIAGKLAGAGAPITLARTAVLIG